MYSDNYMEFASWNAKQKSPLKPFTGTQAAFAEFLITHHKQINKIGDLESVFSQVRLWLKTYPEMWVEHQYVMPAPSIVVISPKEEEIIIEQPGFNWLLPMKDIERKYKNKKPPPEDETPELLAFEKDLYDNKINNEKKIPDLIEYGKGKKMVKCKCIGKTNAVIGYRIDVGTKVYYHAVEDVYLLSNGSGSYITYHPKTIMALIDYNGVMPNGKPAHASPSYIQELLKREGEEPNFHTEEL